MLSEYDRKDIDCGLVGCDAVWTCRWVPTFRRNILPSLKIEAVCSSETLVYPVRPRIAYIVRGRSWMFTSYESSREEQRRQGRYCMHSAVYLYSLRHQSTRQSFRSSPRHSLVRQVIPNYKSTLRQTQKTAFYSFTAVRTSGLVKRQEDRDHFRRCVSSIVLKAEKSHKTSGQVSLHPPRFESSTLSMNSVYWIPKELKVNIKIIPIYRISPNIRRPPIFPTRKSAKNLFCKP
jgi:hypothetical protein